MPTEDKALREKLTKLRALQAEHLEKAAACGTEMDALLSGGAGIGEILKRLERHFNQVWSVRYAPGGKGGYVWQFAKDVPNLKRLLKTLTVDDIERRMLAYLQNADPFFVKARHSFGLFVSTINQHASAEASEELELQAPTVPGCKHAPPCVSDQEHTRRRNAEMRSADAPYKSPFDANQ